MAENRREVGRPECVDRPCEWEPTGGGEPRFTRNSQMWFGERAHVRCRRCGCRTWLSREEWSAYTRAAGPDAEGRDG